MKLYYSPGACSIGIHILLEEIGKPYEAVKVSLMEGEQYKPPFVAINPKSKVPTLALDDGSVLTEYAAIATYLARTYPEAKLLPEDTAHYVRAIEALDYAVGTVHMQAFARMFRPGNFTPNEADQEAVRAKGREMAVKGYALLDSKLAGKEWVAGPYTVADTALFYVMFWGAKRMNIELPPNCAAHFARMLARPAVQRTLAAEGFA
jgi:glutathione S-transferase